MLYARGDARLSGDIRPAASGGAQRLSPGTDDGVLDASFARVIADFCDPGAAPFIPALGLDEDGFHALLQRQLPHFAPRPDWLAAQQAQVATSGVLDEFRDLLELLLAHRAVPDAAHRDVAHLVAAACMGSNHLWQDMGLPSRSALSTLLSSRFPDLAARNTGNMKWKKFFYRQLCERAGFSSCNRPSCAACCDYDACFGVEE